MTKNNNNKEEPLEKQLWKAADKLRKNIDAAEYKHIVLGLIFLKYISDAFEELHEKLQSGEGEYAGADPEDRIRWCARRGPASRRHRPRALAPNRSSVVLVERNLDPLARIRPCRHAAVLSS